MIEKYNLNQVAGFIGIPGVGRTKLYMILRELKIVDENNKPDQKYVDARYLAVGTPRAPWRKNGSKSYVTLAVGQRGLNFIDETVWDYLEKNPIPKITRQPRIRYSTDI